MYKAQLDVSSECSVRDLIALVNKTSKTSTDRTPVDFKLVDAYGPGGGNPVFEFSHTDRNRIVDVVRDLTDDTDPKFINSLIK